MSKLTDNMLPTAEGEPTRKILSARELVDAFLADPENSHLRNSIYDKKGNIRLGNPEDLPTIIKYITLALEGPDLPPELDIDPQILALNYQLYGIVNSFNLESYQKPINPPNVSWLVQAQIALANSQE